ncbi:MAG TPA: 6-pyruvoyl-tetrahydropterin synthase-related protein, partial [Anaerolineae bacterium]|nr:6-pyruvoyl-tetrahydropterin synthase-related protein [Anaerolineae bacterium]
MDMIRNLRRWWEKNIGNEWLLLGLILVVAVWPFLSRADLPQETDAELHIFRLAELERLVREGIWYPRWAPNFYMGYGYPIFNYYAPLSYYAGLPVALLPGMNAVEGVKFVFVLGLGLGAAGMYGLGRDNWGRPAGYVAAATFLYAPYIQYIDPHARGVLAESFALGLLPFSWWLLQRGQARVTMGRWWGVVLSVAAVALAHNLMTMVSCGLLLAWLVWSLVAERRRENWLMLAAFGLGIGVSAFFWGPVALERNAINLNTLIGEGDNFDFRTHFLSVGELLRPWARLDWRATEPEFHFSLGLAAWLGALMGVGVWLWQGRRGWLAEKGSWWRGKWWFLSFLVMAGAGLLFLMSAVSAPVWEWVPVLPFLQFPWRLLGATAVILGLLAGAGVAEVGAWLGAERGRWLALAGVALPMILGWPASQASPWPADFGPVDTGQVFDIEFRGRWLGTTSTADFVPATVELVPYSVVQLAKSLLAGEPLDPVNYAAVPAGVEVDTAHINSLHKEIRVRSEEDWALRLFIFDFPGWEVRVDGELVETDLGRPEGFIVVPLTAGEHLVVVSFETTGARQLSWGITVVALLLAGVGGYWWGERRG